MNRAAIATLALGAAVLFPNWAAAHVLRLDDLQPLLEDDERERLTREILPIVHDCPQTALPVRIRAQDMTEDELADTCNLLKETEDVFHATMETDPASPVNDFADVEVLVFSTWENMDEYRRVVLGLTSPTSGGSLWGTTTLQVQGYTNAMSHEYVHYLDLRFGCLCGMLEGLAEYISLLVHSDTGVWYIKLVGDGFSLPLLADVATAYYDWRDYSHEDWTTYIYGWGYLAVRFLFEQYPQVILTMYHDFSASLSASMVAVYKDYANDVLAPLSDDFHSWLREFVPITTRQIKPVMIFQEVDQSGNSTIFINLANYFLTSQSEVTYTVSFSVPYDVRTDGPHDVVGSEIVSGLLIRDELYLYHTSGLGTVEVTVTATAPIGDSAELTFTVTVVEALRTRAIVPDSVVIGERETAIRLASYYTGPDLSDVEFTVASNDTDVARVAVRDGRLIITAVAVGEADITLRSVYHGRETTQTFTVAVTDDCPAYLCRGFFNGWRWLLLEDGQAATETTETE